MTSADRAITSTRAPDPGPAFVAVPPATETAAIPVVVHVPHASTVIPPDVRAGIDLDDGALALELLRMTDHRTDELAAEVGDAGAWRFVNRTSRLVVDPERFPDGDEMDARGMGAVYSATHDRSHLRHVTAEQRDALLARFFQPYATALADLVSEVLGRFGTCTIVDLHSYPTVHLPYETAAPDAPRPPLCIGVDVTHTPPWLTALVEDAAADAGLEAAVNSPFAGAYVPLDRYDVDRCVSAVMLELRRDTYLDETTASPHDGAGQVRAFVTEVVRRIGSSPQARAIGG